MSWKFQPDQPSIRSSSRACSSRSFPASIRPGASFHRCASLQPMPGANPNTVQRAFAELERAGLIYTQRTAGKFVTEDAAAVAAARRSLAEAQTRQYLAAMRALGCGKQEIHNLFDQMEEQEHADL